MANIANIILNDGKSTPVPHTFSPVEVTNGIAFYEDRVNGIAIAYPTLSMSLRKPTSTGKTYKSLAKIVLPVLKPIVGSTSAGYQASPDVSHKNTFRAEFDIDARSTPEERKDIYAFAENLLRSLILKDQVINYERNY